MPITIKDIAKLANVSTATVSFVLNNSSKVSEETRKRVLEIIKETGYTPNIFARGLVSSKTNTIAVIVPFISHVFGDRYFGEGISGIYDTAKKYNYKIMLEQASYEFAATKKYLELFKEHSIDGMLYLGSTINDTYLIDFAGRDYPFILVNSYLPNIDISAVYADNITTGYKAMEYFYNSGHRRIAFIYGSMNVTGTIDQYVGIKKFFEEKNLTLSGHYVVSGDFTEEGGYKGTLTLLENENLPTAIFCGNDLMAIGCIKALKENKIRVPQDIAVMGCDNIKIAEYTEPKLSTFKMDIYEIASLACEKLIQQIENKTNELIKIILPMEMIIRESTDTKINQIDEISKVG